MTLLRSRSLTLVLLAVTIRVTPLFAQATTGASTRPAVLQLLIPDDAAVTVDEKELGKERWATIDQINPGETRRVTVKIKFQDGAEEERLVDVEQGQTIPVPVPPPQPDRAVAVPTQAVDPVLALALSPNGRNLAIGLDSNSIVVWDLSAGLPTRSFLRHRAPVQSVVFSPDGKYLLSGSGDNTAILWDFSTGNPIRIFKGHTDQVMSVAFSPDGQRILTGSMDKTAIIWDTNAGQKLQTLTGHTNQVFGIAFSPDGKTIATASLDRTGAIWEAETGRLLFTLRGHSDGVSCVTFSPDGTTIATGSFDNSAIFWDVSTGRRLKQTGKHEIDIYGVTYTPDGHKLLTAARDEVVMMWDANTGRKLRTFLGHNSDVGGAVVSREGRLMFSCSRDGMVKLWDLATGMELASLITDSSRKSWAVVTPDGLFDASEPGQHMMGFRFVKAVGGSLDQFFAERYHPGLLTELYLGQRPFSANPLGHAPPPLVKIVSPKTRSTPTTMPVSITVEATDQGGGVSALRLFNNGASIALKQDLPKFGPAGSIRVTFDDVPLTPGINQIRVIGSNADESWESAPAEIELNDPQTQRSKPRMYVVAIGDSQALAEMLRGRAARLYDRVDIIPVPDRDSTREMIEDTLSDVAALTRPQDSMVVVLCGSGSMKTDEILFAPRGLSTDGEGLAVDELAATLGTAAALQRAMILDLVSPRAEKSESASVLRGAVERLSHSRKIHAVVSLNSTGQDPGLLGKALLAAAPESSDMMDWFRIAAEQVGGQCSTQSSGFPIFSRDKP